MYLYSNILGTFVFNQNFQIREKVAFAEKDLLKNFGLLEKGEILETEKEFMAKFKNIVNLRQDPDPRYMEKIYESLSKLGDDFYEKNIFLTRMQIRNSITNDLLIIQTSGCIEELGKTINLNVKRLREWYSYVLPEVEDKVEDHEMFAELVARKSRQDLIKDFSIKNSMGYELKERDSKAIHDLANAILNIAKEKQNKENYLESVMRDNCPNITAVAGFLVGAKLIGLAGSLKNLVLMPSSTVQLLGAEKALFRHMLNKNSKPPKHGIIMEHQLLQKSKRADRGKVARSLADKILLAAKIDYFKGEFIGDRLYKELEEKVR